MYRKNIMLFNVLNQEVVFEEYFCNLLSIDDFKNLFLEFINDKNTAFSKIGIECENFDTEINLGAAYGRADLYLKYQNKEYIFEIKNKEKTTLTVKQPTKYLQYLNKKEPKAEEICTYLFFILPKNYRHKEEIFKRWKIEDLNIRHFAKLKKMKFINSSKVLTMRDFQYQWVEFCKKSINNNQIENQMLYWEEFITKLYNSELCLKYKEIKMFYDFCAYWFNMEIIELTEFEKKLLKKGNMMDGYKDLSVPRLMKKLEEITHQVAKNISGMKKATDTYESFVYSKTSKLIKPYSVSFGIDYTLWEEIGTPLNIIIQNTTNDYQEFELPPIEGIELIAFEYDDTSESEKQFAYIVNLDKELGDIGYQDTVEKVINLLILNLEKYN